MLFAALVFCVVSLALYLVMLHDTDLRDENMNSICQDEMIYPSSDKEEEVESFSDCSVSQSPVIERMFLFH